MNVAPWWERWPKVMKRELEAFAAAGMVVEIDEKAKRRGVLTITTSLSLPQGRIPLTIVYPETYPYFRCLVYAPTLNLKFHQNPFERNLCLLGRRTHYWNADDTAAGLITRQLPMAIATAGAEAAHDVLGLEEIQAEPFGDYYPYKPGMLLLDGNWKIPKGNRSGNLRMRLSEDSEPCDKNCIRGVVKKVLSSSGQELCAASQSLIEVFQGKEVEGVWSRVDAPIPYDSEMEFLKALVSINPAMAHAKYNHVGNMWLRIWGVLFPEETGHRTTGEGWVFVCAVDDKRPQPGRTSQSRNAKQATNKKRQLR